MSLSGINLANYFEIYYFLSKPDIYQCVVQAGLSELNNDKCVLIKEHTP